MKPRRVILPALLVAALACSNGRMPSPPQARAAWEIDDRIPDVSYVPTPPEVVEKMLELARVTRDDVVYDLGCGDGRIVVTAARKYGCKACGFDIDPQRIKESLENVKKNQVEDLVTIKKQNIFTLDLSEASVVTLYLLPELNVRLVPQLEKMKPGSRIVSNNFDMRGVKPDKVVPVQTRQGVLRHVYLWTVPLKKTAGESRPLEQTTAEVPANRAQLLVKLPTARAELTIAGDPTRQTGDLRLFESPVLEAGASYSYDLVASWEKDGRRISVKRRVPLQIGGRVVVDFTSEPAEQGKGPL
jgi:uncharacterized protein (TIGR03000 family)